MWPGATVLVNYKCRNVQFVHCTSTCISTYNVEMYKCANVENLHHCRKFYRSITNSLFPDVIFHLRLYSLAVGHEKGSDHKYILKDELSGLPIGMHVVVRQREKSPDDFRVQSK